jgi:hypothetical protein
LVVLFGIGVWLHLFFVGTNIERSEADEQAMIHAEGVGALD